MELILKLKNGGKEELTMDEARELYNELKQLFHKPDPIPLFPTPMNPWDIIGAPVSQTWYGPAKGIN